MGGEERAVRLQISQHSGLSAYYRHRESSCDRDYRSQEGQPGALLYRVSSLGLAETSTIMSKGSYGFYYL